MIRRLERSTTNRAISGVCGGLAEYLQIDAGIVRAFFIIASLVTAGVFILVYFALLILMPLPGQRAPIDDMWPGARTTSPVVPADPNAPTPDEAATRPAPPPPDPEAAERRRSMIGYVLVALGVIFLLSNAGAFRFVEWKVIWPLALVAFGVFLVMQRGRR